MSVVAVIGAQWGDEGKGRIVDLLASQADVVARYQGGNNAGHTVVNHLGTFKLHLVPAGIFDARVTCVIGNGVVIDPLVLLGELDQLHARDVAASNLLISDRAHVVMPYHIQFDALEEAARGAGKIGTTGRGVGPAYVDKASRVGIRMCDLIDPRALRARLTPILAAKNRVLTAIYGAQPLDLETVLRQYLTYGEALQPYVADTGEFVRQAIATGRHLLLEGGQGTLLDLDHGTYPFVTSSSPTAGGACAGLGIPPTSIDRAVGIYKAYTTRVGAGPFPSELDDEVGERIRDRGQEYGTTTGRARRCGWFDAVAARYSARINGFDGVAITKLDVLDSEETIRVCVGYTLAGQRVDTIPADLDAFGQCQPIYETLPGWQTSTADVRSAADLPPRARDYVQYLGAAIGCPVDLVSVGFRREQVIVYREAFN